MARRWYGINRGATPATISEDSATTGKDIQLDIDRAVSLRKSDIVRMVEQIADKIVAGNFPPAVTTISYRGYGAQLGGRAQDILEESPTAATGTVTCASVLEADTATINGAVLTAQDLREKFTVLCVADNAGSLNNTYFTFSKSGTNYYVWYNVNSAGVDPALAGKTAVPVAVATNAANTVVASATNTAIDALAGVSSTVSSATVTVVIDAIGAVTDAAQGAVTTGFTITVTRQGADTPGTDKFAMNTSDTATGASLVAAVAASAQAGNLVGVNASGVVTFTAVEDGTAGNALTLASSHGSRLAVSGAVLANGAAAAASKNIRAELRMDKSLAKNDVVIGFSHLRNYILASAWPLS